MDSSPLALAPQNKFEEYLLQHAEQQIPLASVFEVLINSQVALLLEAPVPEDKPELMSPLILEAPGGFRALAVFTSDQRAAPAVQHFTQFPHGAIIDGIFAVEGITQELGLSINPGWKVGVDISPPQLVALCESYGLRR